jgi:CRISPR-associated protein Cas2
MSYRIMRLIVMYDLPTDDDNLIYYTKFRKELIKMGFIMIQFSIYVKVYPNHTSMQFGKDKIRKISPDMGNVRMLYLTEKQYEDIELISGEKSINEINSTSSRYIEV